MKQETAFSVKIESFQTVEVLLECAYYRTNGKNKGVSKSTNSLHAFCDLPVCMLAGKTACYVFVDFFRDHNLQKTIGTDLYIQNLKMCSFKSSRGVFANEYG